MPNDLDWFDIEEQYLDSVPGVGSQDVLPQAGGNNAASSNYNPIATWATSLSPPPTPSTSDSARLSPRRNSDLPEGALGVLGGKKGTGGKHWSSCG